MMQFYEPAPLKSVVNKKLFDALHNACVTAFAIYDRTLEKAKDAGQVKVLSI